MPVEDVAAVSVHPEGRFEWERIIRRAKLPPTTKYVALLLATYGDRNGTRVRPGMARLVAVTGLSRATVQRAVSGLRSLGLIDEVVSGSRTGRARSTSEYRLTLPDDLLDRLTLLDPDEVEQGSPVSPGLLLPLDGRPVDNSPGPGLKSGGTRAQIEGDQGSLVSEPGLMGEAPPQQDHNRDHPQTTTSTSPEQRARETPVDNPDGGRRFAAAVAELQRLPDFGLSLIEEVRAALPGDPDWPTLVITAGEVVRERRRSA